MLLVQDQFYWVLTHLAVVGAGPVLLGAEDPAGGMARPALGAHLGLHQTEPHLFVPTVKKLLHLAVVGAGPVALRADTSCCCCWGLTYLAVGAAGPVLLGAEGSAGGVARSSLGAHLGLHQLESQHFVPFNHQATDTPYCWWCRTSSTGC